MYVSQQSVISTAIYGYPYPSPLRNFAMRLQYPPFAALKTPQGPSICLCRAGYRATQSILYGHWMDARVFIAGLCTNISPKYQNPSPPLSERQLSLLEWLQRQKPAFLLSPSPVLTRCTLYLYVLFMYYGRPAVRNTYIHRRRRRPVLDGV